jgi:hypothetical protein
LVSQDRVVGTFFFAAITINIFNYLDMMELYVLSQIKKENFILQQDSEPPHHAEVVRDFLDENLPQSWIGRDGEKACPPRSPDLFSLDFYCGVMLKQGFTVKKFEILIT